MPPHPAAALLSKRWDLLAEYKDQYWREGKRLGAWEALRVEDAVRAHVQSFHPSWSTPEDQEADLQTHIRVSAMLARTAPGLGEPRTKPSRSVQGSLRGTRRPR